MRLWISRPSLANDAAYAAKLQGPRDAASYTLQRHPLRSFMTFAGPLVLVAFYTFIVKGYLMEPPVNGYVNTESVDATWVYWLWLLMAIFGLDWARAGLANVEAAALMMPRLAPQTAASLMWHTDMKWANPLWWLRALSTLARRIPLIRGRNARSHPLPTPLWFFLSVTSFLLFVALPLSGLTMELSSVMARSKNIALIYGPNSTTFKGRFPELRIPWRIYDLWQSGRPVVPSHNGLLYVPEGITQTSNTYVDDQINEGESNLRFFTAPTVHEAVTGRAWGMDSEFKCVPVPSTQLRLLRIHDLTNVSLHACMPEDLRESQCNMEWFDNVADHSEEGKSSGKYFPIWFNITGEAHPYSANISLVVAADGWQGTYEDQIHPYSTISNHDTCTLDHVSNITVIDEPTSAIFEVFLWQGGWADTYEKALVPESLTDDKSGIVKVLKQAYTTDYGSGYTTHYGVGISCDVKTVVGDATIDPGSRAYTSFSPGKAPLPVPYGYSPGPTLPLQELALQSFMWSFDGLQDPMDRFWRDLHSSIGLMPIAQRSDYEGTFDASGYPPALGPQDLQKAVMKLLSYGAISMMDEVGIQPFEADLYTLQQTRYITPGRVSWIYVIVILTIWATLVSGSGVWLFFAGPRWAPSLDGFEMFKLGAQYAETLEQLQTRDFRDSECLGSIPGMIGVLPGTSDSAVCAPDKDDDKSGFIGLSENAVVKDGFYTFSRNDAARTRQRIQKRK